MVAPWIILFAPLAACLTISFFALRAPKAAAALAMAGILASFAATLWLCASLARSGTAMPVELAWEWLRVPGLRAEFGFLIDPLSVLMLLVVTGVGSCIFLYSTGYMKGDGSYSRYFATLSLFAFSMIGIVLANNFFMLFVFWELVAVSSYLLIGFWFEKPSAADAGNKAFIVNRLADFGFVLGIFLVWMLSGSIGALGAERTFSFTGLAHALPEAAAKGLVPQGLVVAAGLLVFCGVVGKSAQFPLYIWLPDAMEGPTPVSALIHAATMVAAGVYLLTRTFFLVEGSAAALGFIAALGALTALLAAGLALVQTDIKKILAYSTVSQLGYMVAALGLGGPEAAMYHLTTHAFFKALLFLGAGSMIHALHTQDIWEMGGLRREMPVTANTFLIGTLALCGIAPLSGFFSKDEILTLAFEHNKAVFAALLFAAALTAFYMARAVWIAILGPKRPKHGHGHEHAHESPLVMTAPLVLLAVLSVIGGFIGIPAFIAGGHPHEAEGLNWTVAALSTLAALGGLAAGTALYRRAKTKEDPLVKALGALYGVLVQKYYLDHFFLGVGRFFQNTVSRILFWFDWNVIIQKGVNGTAAGTRAVASGVRRWQTGRVQTYAMAFGFGVVVLVWTFLMKAR
ncbi:MAG TPA: NADH-quinone oxidoreductase subunit L [Candidatus Eisenbacteria bacterium]|nr:NADH-quinone oxidoreductase subunit L [Candidatus Eisenbacteria bacterium]